MGNGELVGQLRALQNGDWLVTTPSGLFDGSPGGWRQLAWRVGDGMSVLPGELYFNEFYQPGLLGDLLGGRPVRQVRAVSERDRRQPTVTLQAQVIEERRALVRVRVGEAPAAVYSQGSGARDEAVPQRCARQGLARCAAAGATARWSSRRTCRSSPEQSVGRLRLQRGQHQERRRPG